MTNLTQQTHKNQVKSLTYNHFSYLLNKMGNDIRLGKLKRKAYRKIFSYITFLSNVYESVEVSQAKVAQMTGYSRQTVNEAFDYFDEMHYVKKVYRHRKTCLYILDPVFYEDLVREKFGHIFRGLKIKSKKIAVSLLYSLRLKAKEYYEKLYQLKSKTKITLHQLTLKVLRVNLTPTPMYLQGDCKGGTTGKKIENGKYGNLASLRLGVGGVEKMVEEKNQVGEGYVKSERELHDNEEKHYSWQDPIRVDHRLSCMENQQQWYGFESECKESYVRNRGMNEFLILKRDFMIEVCKIKKKP